MPAAPETRSASERARRLWDGSFDSTARKLLEELMDQLSAQEIIEALLPWVADRVRASLRGDVRRAEAAAFARPSGLPPRVITEIRAQTGALPALDNLEALLDLPVLVPSPGHASQSVRWRDMTVTDHQARIAVLRRPLHSITTGVRRHEWSIAEIRKYKVHCLGDIALRVLKDDMKLALGTRSLATVASQPEFIPEVRNHLS